MKKLFLIILVFPFFVLAQIPAGYYNTAEGKTGASLKTALFGIVSDHTQRTYANLWTDFQTTDKRADGKVWDIYSNATDYTFVTNQCGNYKAEGDCYNREHSFPASWFSDGYPMYTDLFHLYPSDGYVNNRRGNYPFGETGSITYQSANGYCKLGNATATLGYSGIVFEPNNELKGDFARTYFYMVTAYEDRVAGWYSNVDARPTINGTTYPAFTDWTINLLLRWHRQDPVSKKETDRNNAVYTIQNNRNPFIDYPELAEFIWGNSMGDAWYAVTGTANITFSFNIVVRHNSLLAITDVENLTYTLYNTAGQRLQNGKLPDNKEISLSGLPAGLYIIKLNNTDLQYVDKFFVSENF